MTHIDTSPVRADRAEVLAALPTMVDAGGAVDEDATTALLARLEPVLDGVFVAGTTGEFPALRREERELLAGHALRVFGPDRVVVHVGAAGTAAAVGLTRDAVALGARRLASLTPFYLPADLGAVRGHFAAVTAAAGDADVYGYLFPERSGVEVSPGELAELAAAVGLAGAKLSGSAAARFAGFRAALPPEADLWSGSDTELASVWRAGGRGVVSGLSAAFPEPFVALAQAVASDDIAAEQEAQRRCETIAAATGGRIEGLTLALSRQGIGSATTLMPHPELDPGLVQAIEALVASGTA